MTGTAGTFYGQSPAQIPAGKCEIWHVWAWDQKPHSSMGLREWYCAQSMALKPCFPWPHREAGYKWLVHYICSIYCPCRAANQIWFTGSHQIKFLVANTVYYKIQIPNLTSTNFISNKTIWKILIMSVKNFNEFKGDNPNKLLRYFIQFSCEKSRT